MIITELRKSECELNNLFHYDSGISKELKEFDKDLILLWNKDDNRWEFYRIKDRSLDPLYHWQISAPVKSKLITVGVIDWLKKFDTNPMGFKDKDDLKKQFKQMFKELLDRFKARQEKEKVEDFGPTAELFKSASVNKVVSGPVRVVVNPRNGKKTYIFAR